MKIAENGNMTGRELTCDSCGCRFRIESEDSPTYALENTRGEILEALYRCPQCLHLISVKFTEVKA